MKVERGFTLLEVMIALVVFATLAAAVMSASQYVLGQNARAQNQLFATWLADNHLSELALQPQALVAGRKTFNQQFAQRNWYVNRSIVVEPGIRMLRVELSVSPVGSDQATFDMTHWLLLPK